MKLAVHAGKSRATIRSWRELARSFVQGGMALSAAWDQQVKREAKEAERQQARAEERRAQGLPPEPEQGRERQTRGLGLSR